MRKLELSTAYLLQVGETFTFFREEIAQEFKLLHIGEFNNEGYAKATLEVLKTGETTETDIYRLSPVYLVK